KHKDDIELHASISDTGIGIPESKLKDLFKPYSQVGDVYDGLANGTGLGLVICKEYAELLGGKISVTSKEGEGSTFNFIIKCRIQSKDDAKDLNKIDKEVVESQFFGGMENY